MKFTTAHHAPLAGYNQCRQVARLSQPRYCPFWLNPGNSAQEHEKQTMSREEKSKQRVLVADDERVIADTLAMILNQSGFETRAVYSGEQAIETAAIFQPEMLISDVIMAGVNGIDAAIQIRSLLPEIKVLLFSGQAATADLLEKARDRGYDFEILAKPVHPQDLLARMRR